jgi:proteasome accessory factor C
MNKWEKVVLLDRLLKNSKYCVPLKKILRELSCSDATFHRVRDFMQTNLNAPISYSRKYKGYYYENNDEVSFELPGFWLTKNEIDALLCIDMAVENLQQGFLGEILKPIRSRFEAMLKAQRSSLSSLRKKIRIIPICSRGCNDDIFRIVSSAIINDKRLKIRHVNLADNTISERTISPQALVRYRDNWYVDAYCHLRNGLRSFALNRIKTADIDDEKFQKVSQHDMESFFASSYGIFNGTAEHVAVINFSGIAAREVCDEKWHPKQEGEWINGDVYRLTFPYGNSHELEMDILKWGKYACVVEPEDLKENIKVKITEMMKIYEKK